jgi:DNA primase
MASNIYSEEQIRRVLNGSGMEIEAEFGNDFIVYCPYHNNSRTPAGEVAKDSGLFFCFGCQTTKNLEEFIMFTTGRSYFETVRYIKSK